MARILSQTLIRDSQLFPSNSIVGGLSQLPSPFALLLNLRFRSNRSEKAAAQLLEVDLEAETSEVVEIIGACCLKDAMCGIIPRRSAPLWLPFAPGSSYWVPPKEKPDGGNSVKLSLLEV